MRALKNKVGFAIAGYVLLVLTGGFAEAALTLQASGDEGFVDLSWEQDDYELFAGYNLYRADGGSDSFQRINRSIIPVGTNTYRDTNAVPGQSYDYYFKVVLTDLTESESSNIGTGAPLDTIPTQITHSPVTSAQPNLSLTIAAGITDNVTVTGATLRHRLAGSGGAYSSKNMVNTTGDRWTATLEGSLLQSPGVEYYLSATDGVSTTFAGRSETPYLITMDDRPVVTGITPNHGPASGGTVLQVTGTNFKEGAIVSFGSTAAASVSFVSGTQLDVTTPAHIPSTITVTVTNPGDRAGTLLNGFTFTNDLTDIYLPDVVAESGGFVTVPLDVANVSGLVAFGVTITYDPTKLSFSSVTKGALLQDWTLVANTTVVGVIRLASASGGAAFLGSGSIATIDFQVLGQPGDVTPLSLSDVSLNGSTIRPTRTQGGVNIVQDTTKPVITLLGESQLQFEASPGGTYVDAGASCQDVIDGDLSNAIVVSGDVVDLAVPGTYQVLYNCEDLSGNAADPVTRTVVVQDTTKPVITLLGEATLQFEARPAGTYVDAGASCQDVIDGELSNAIVVSGDVVDLAVPGTYQVLYNCEDLSGNAADPVTRTVIVQDTTKPVITLLGEATLHLEANLVGNYVDAGATCQDLIDGDLSNAIVVSGDVVDLAVPGTYQVLYNCEDHSGNAADPVTRTVTVQDTTKPVITLAGEATLQFEADPVGSYLDAGATCQDLIDGDLSNAIVVSGDVVDLAVPGTYQVLYNCEDHSGNAADPVTRTVTVQDTTKPVITLAGEATLQFEADPVGSYLDAGATCQDLIDGDLSNAIVVSGDVVDLAVPGTYQVLYNCEDHSGNAADPVTRTVTVQDTTKPVITLAGEATLRLEASLTGNYLDAGATCQDLIDGDLSNAIVVSGDVVDLAVPGTYQVLYNCEDHSGNAADPVTRTVTVQDTTKPVITLLGEATLQFEADPVGSYLDAGATCQDLIDGDLSNAIVVSGDVVDLAVPGTYQVLYNCEDHSGNAADPVTRTVTVQDTTKPVITLAGEATLRLEASLTGNYLDAGATCQDLIDGDLSNAIVVSGDIIDMRVPGTYQITYSCADSTGNNATPVVRTIIVEDTVPDLDGDDIPNWVEVAMGFDPQDPSDGLADDDGDGKSNGKEWLAGTDRLDRNSVLEILSVVDLTGALDQFEVTWTSVSNPGVFYDLELSEDGHAWIPIEIDIPATAPLTQRIVNRLSPSGRLFFRVGARRP